MSTFPLLVFIAALVATTAAQSTSPTVWASVAMIMHGERTPLRSVLSNTLTPRGAQQLYAQGEAFRSRYLTGVASANSTENTTNSSATIKGIARNVVEHEQLSILAASDAHIAAGAIAFMQGLYPPITQAFGANVGGNNISYSTPSGEMTQYPLNGYQYPIIETVGSLDERSIAVRGNIDCPQWRISTQQIMHLDPYMTNLYKASLPKYQSLFSKPPFNGTIALHNANFWDAYNIYDYIRYRYSHEQDVYQAMMDTYAKDSQFLKMYARQQQLNMTSNKEVSGLKKGDMIRTIAGRTFSQKVLDALRANGNFAGFSNKLTLLFGSHETFLSFFALAQLQGLDLTLASPFWNIPEPGAAMIFELIGDQPGRPDAYPTEDSLYVRFLYRKDADPDTPFEEFSLFGLSSSDSRMTLSLFKQEMQKFGVDVSSYCSICGSVQPFCKWGTPDTPKTIGEYIRSAVQKPVVAGIIGGAIVLAALGLVVLVAAVFGRCRIRRAGGKDKDKDDRAAGLGGFKAAEKMASDPDLSISKRGVHHERTGSWELREVRDIIGQVGLVVDKSSPTFQAKVLDDDAVSVVDAIPVKPREGV
ncbi:hypothetical protein CCHL11_01363 [Colletotrichum chlorophyti]|uniref:Uncharacterized protein n=1 Tax=Colletotrichum chlorophyti TaxID=708187 RepID=A0A1Q8RYG3_9PEZI|nr:hypothetical protein CCHL11_01363 [Colletotrichum chlorophyti]